MRFAGLEDHVPVQNPLHLFRLPQHLLYAREILHTVFGLNRYGSLEFVCKLDVSNDTNSISSLHQGCKLVIECQTVSGIVCVHRAFSL